MDFSVFWEYKDFFFKGVLMTILLSVVGIILGSILGSIVALLKLSSNKVLKGIATGYVELIRGTPILIQLWMVYLLFDTSALVAGFAALSINSGAYVAEIIRSGIQSVDRGQMEAARSLGMSSKMAMRHIIFPQAIKNIIPVLGNEFIAIVKESSIVSVLGVGELMYSVTVVRGISFDSATPLAAVFVLYFILTFTLTKGVNKIERRMKTSDRRK